MLSVEKDVSWLAHSSGAFGLSVLPGKQLETHLGAARLCCLPHVDDIWTSVRVPFINTVSTVETHPFLSPSHLLVPTLFQEPLYGPRNSAELNNVSLLAKAARSLKGER